MDDAGGSHAADFINVENETQNIKKRRSDA